MPGSTRIPPAATNIPDRVLAGPEVAMDYAWFLFSFKGRIQPRQIPRCAAGSPHFLAHTLAQVLVSLRVAMEALHWVVAITMIWINAATTVKRLHDRNRSDLWAVAIFIVNRLSCAYYGLFFGLYFGVFISIAEELLLRDCLLLPVPSANLDYHRVVFPDGNRRTQPVRT